MKKFLLLSVVTLGMLTSCACSGLKVHYSKTDPHGVHERDLKGFERVELLGSLDVKYAQADSFSVRVDAPVKVLNDVETYVTGNKLVVKMKGEGNIINLGVSDADDVTVFVTSPDFLGIELKGSGDFESNGLVDTDNLDITLSGSGDIKFDDIICDRVNVSLVGSGDVDVKHVKTQWAGVQLVGSGDVKMRLDDSGAVDANVIGSGDITLSGNVKDYKYNVRGSGDMNTSGLTIGK
ncbi:MAG: DUF2807 domain-containing protein [Prevotella sp.]|nr:DUF2807 domain-containing protein [Prevotella sp.]